MDKWLEYWQQDELQADVFTDKDGNKHEALLTFWQQHIAKFAGGESVLDIASGAGAIYRCIPDISLYDAHALDISSDALTRLKSDVPSVHTHAQMLDDASFTQQQFDGVFSQFGIEYLGDSGFSHVPRLLKDGATCIFLSHIKGGVVDQVTQQSLQGLKIVEQTQFLNLAQNVADAFQTDDKQQVQQCVGLFMKVEPMLAQYCAKVPQGHHVHLYEGVKKLLSNYNNYEHSIIIKWIDVARQQALENIERLQSMHNAALDQDDIDRLSSTLAKQGLSVTSAKPFYLRAEDPPAAWEIIGVKQS